MKKIFLATIFLMCTIVMVAAEQSSHNISKEKIKSIVPKDWTVKSIDVVNAPLGWRRTSGSEGLQIYLERKPYSLKKESQKDGSKDVSIPTYYICLMPMDFIGKDANGLIFENGQIISPEISKSVAMNILSFKDKVENYYVFSSYEFKELKPTAQFAKEIIDFKNKISE